LLNLRDALADIEAPRPDHAQAAHTADTRPAPPRRGEVPEPQRPLSPALPTGHDQKGIARTLLGETEAAIARLTLSQIASLPSDHASHDLAST
ncbi:hypothetical protein, partial [Staphylococcus aureus]